MEVKMKLLWIEDFGSGVAGSKIAIDMFGDLIPKSIFDDEYNHDEEVWTELPRLFEKHTIHRIYICKSYLEWKKVYGDHNGDFDIIFIDINLEAYKTPKSKIPVNHLNFDKKAGFYIYNQLIKDCFPEDNIVFFTAEGNSLKNFERMCGEMLTDKPKNAFEKKSTHYERLRKWITKKINSRYYILRRGIIEGCRFLKKELENTKANDLEQRLLFYKTTSDTVFHNPEFYRTEVEDYLKKLENFLPLKPPDDLGHVYQLFIKEMVEKWEKSFGYFRREKGTLLTNSMLEENLYKTSQFMMKLVRNWLSHGKFSSDISEREVAYFFILAMRSRIRLDTSKVYFHELILSDLFNSFPLEEINKENMMIRRCLDESFFELNKEFKSKPDIGESDNYFLSLLNYFGKASEISDGSRARISREYIRERSIRLFYQGYWHGLFPLWLNFHKDGIIHSVNFVIEQVKDDTFPFFLGRMIFRYAFEHSNEGK
jgi:hypothetical protein